MIETLLEKLSGLHVKLVAVSKTQPPERILELYNAGQRIFGENRVQEMLTKKPALPGDVQWHMIGHLQTNKVRQIAPFVSMIHSVDRWGLLEEINKEALKNSRTIDCLLQFHIAQEETKYGFDIGEAVKMLESREFQNLRNVRICGVMGMATFTENLDQVRLEFRTLKSIFDQLKEKYFKDQSAFAEISMGMSGDWEIAVEEGSTMVRLGTLLFGSR